MDYELKIESYIKIPERLMRFAATAALRTIEEVIEAELKKAPYSDASCLSGEEPHIYEIESFLHLPTYKKILYQEIEKKKASQITQKPAQ